MSSIAARQPQIVPLLIHEVPMPNWPLGFPKEGTVWLGGHINEPLDQFKLDSQFLPPGIYKTVRDDLARWCSVPVTRAAISRHKNEYIGVIDSNGEPYVFALNSLGILVRKAEDSVKAWEAFDQLMDAERAAGLQYKRQRSSDDLNLMTMTKAQKPYGHVAYSRQSKSGKVSLIKQKGTKPVDLHGTNPFHEVEDMIAHRAHEHLLTKQPKTFDDVLKHLRKIVRKEGSVDVHGDAKRLYTYMHKNNAFITHNDFSLDRLAKGLMERAVKGKLVAYAISPSSLNMTYRAPRKQLSSDSQKLIRDQTRALCAKYGAKPRDGHKERGSSYVIRRLGKRIQATHDWSGAVTMSPAIQGRIYNYLERRAQSKDRKLLPSDDELDALRCLVHEHLHGCSPEYLTVSCYRTPRGKQLEEVTTELAARHIAGEEFGSVLQRAQIRKSIEDGRGSYGDWVQDCYGKCRSVMPPGMHSDEIISRMFKASLAVKADTTTDDVSENAAINRATNVFVEALAADLTIDIKNALRDALWLAPNRFYKSLQDTDVVHLIQSVKRYKALSERGKMDPDIGEVLAMEAGDVELATKIFDWIDEGGKLPEDWEQKVQTMYKALPHTDRTGQDRDAKKTPSKKVSSKKAGKNGKTRYNYPEDKKAKAGKGKKPDGQDQNGPQKVAEKTQKEEQTGGDPIAVPREPTPKSVNPQHVANQLQIPVHTLQHVAGRFVKNKDLGGRKGFIKFMRSRTKAFSEKHKLDGDFFGLLFDALVGAGPTVAKKI